MSLGHSAVWQRTGQLGWVMMNGRVKAQVLGSQEASREVTESEGIKMIKEEFALGTFLEGP